MIKQTAPLTGTNDTLMKNYKIEFSHFNIHQIIINDTDKTKRFNALYIAPELTTQYSKYRLVSASYSGIEMSMSPASIGT